MEDKAIFEMMLNKIEELIRENTSLKLKMKYYKQYVIPNNTDSNTSKAEDINKTEKVSVKFTAVDIDDIATTLKDLWD